MTEHKSQDAERVVILPRPRIRAGLTLRQSWRLALGLILGLGLLALAARGIALHDVWAALRQADPLAVALAFVGVLLATAGKVSRWRGLFPRSQRPGISLLTRGLLVGQLSNALIPARVGEVARAYLTGMAGKVSKATALGTVAAEKTFDVLFLLICAGLASALAPLPQWLDVSLAGLAVVGVSLLLLAIALPERKVLAWSERFAYYLPWGIGERLSGGLQRGLTGLAALRRPSMALTACAWSAAIWTVAAGTNWVLFQAFDLPLSVGAALWLLVLLHVGVAPPSSPGRLGVFHALTILGLGTFGVDRSSGLAYATVLHALVYLPQILLGAVALTWCRASPGGREA